MHAFFKGIISRHGCPHTVITDQGTNFKSIFQALCFAFNITHKQSSAYHHQCNGKVEKFIQFLKNSLATVVNGSMRNWDEMLDNVLFVYRISFNRVLSDSPFFLLYGRDAILPQDLMFETPKNARAMDIEEYKMNLLKTLRMAYDKVTNRRELEQARYKKSYDITHKNIEFNIGDNVWVHFGLPEVGKTHKLLPRFDGPYRIVAKLDKVTYRVGNQKQIFSAHVQRLLP